MREFWNREWQQLRKHALVWLLMLSCVALMLVMTHQERTLEQQRALIQVLQGDSQQLFSGRMEDLVNGRKHNEKKESPEDSQVTPAPAPEPPDAAAPPMGPQERFQPVMEPARILRSI